MNETLAYKGYTASLEFDSESQRFFGRVQNTKHFILFDGKTIEEAKANLADLIETFPEDCGELVSQPNAPVTKALASTLTPQHY